MIDNNSTSIALKVLWEDLGIEPSDTILIHSNIRPLLRYFLKRKMQIKPTDILDSLLSHMNSDGNLIFPAFNFDVVRSGIFSTNLTKSSMGLLSETARNHLDSYRTNHPVYSFSSFGKISKDLLNLTNYTSYGIDSPFETMKNHDGKILVIDLEENKSMTYYHHVEEILEVSYRYKKLFKFEIVDELKGISTMKEFSMYVRKIEDGVVTNVEPMGKLLEKMGLYKNKVYMDKISMRIIRIRDLVSETKKVINEGKALGMLYEIE